MDGWGGINVPGQRDLCQGAEASVEPRYAASVLIPHLAHLPGNEMQIQLTHKQRNIPPRTSAKYRLAWMLRMKPQWDM